MISAKNSQQLTRLSQKWIRLFALFCFSSAVTTSWVCIGAIAAIILDDKWSLFTFLLCERWEKQCDRWFMWIAERNTRFCPWHASSKNTYICRMISKQESHAEQFAHRHAFRHRRYRQHFTAPNVSRNYVVFGVTRGCCGHPLYTIQVYRMQMCRCVRIQIADSICTEMYWLQNGRKSKVIKSINIERCQRWHAYKFEAILFFLLFSYVITFFRSAIQCLR